MDINGFYSGEIFDAYTWLGAHTSPDGVTFRVFAPHAEGVCVLINDRQIPMQRICNGQFYLKSKVGVGTEIYASYQRSHIDLQPKGDLSGCFANFICQYQDINFIIRYITDEDTFEISTADVKEVFEGMSLNNYEIITNLTELIHENIGA